MVYSYTKSKYVLDIYITLTLKVHAPFLYNFFEKKFFSALVITVSIVDLGVSHPQEVVYFAFWLLIR